MAEEGKRFTTRTSNILSKIGTANAANQQQAASSSQAAKSGSTTTPTVISTPKVTNTAKAMPSIQTVDISRLSVPQTTTTTATQTTPREQAINLLGSKTKVETPKKAVNLLDTTTEKKDVESTTLPLNVVRTALNMGGQVAKAVTNNLYEQGLDWVGTKFKKLETARENVNKAVGEGAIDLFQGVKQDISTQWKEGEGLGAAKDAVLNTIQGLPRGIARTEYGLAELLDWGIDAQWATDLKNTIKSDLDYWENTRTYQKVKETDSFSDFLKNPLMYAGGTLAEMLPMFINPWVAVPTTFAQIYGETYSDYSQDESLTDAGLNDNQIRLMSLGVAGVNTIIELGSDLVEGIMPWTRPAVKTTEKTIRRKLTKPFMGVVSKLVKGGASEGVEEVLQNEIQDQVAGFNGSDRDLPTWADRITTFGISSIIGLLLQGGNVAIDVKQNKEIKAAFDEWSDAVDNIAPGVSEKEKVTLFSSIVAAKVEDANMSEDRVANYEAETTELYNRIDELTEQLNNTTNEEEKQEINRQIEDANEKIKAIDEIINKGNAMVEQVNQQLQELSQKRMEEQEKEETQTALEELYNEVNKVEGEGENLSEQTMEDLSIIPSTAKDYESFAEAIKQPRNKILKTLSDGDLMRIDEGASRMRASADPELVKTLDFVRKAVQKEMKARYTQKKKTPQKKATKTTLTFKNAKDYIQQMIDIAKKNGEWSSSDDKKLRKRYMGQFLRANLEGDFAAHMPGLKGVNLKQIEGGLTDQKIRDIAEMLSLVSTTFGVDFNKVISDIDMSLNIADDIQNFLYNTNALGQMNWKATKEQIKELINRTGFSMNTVGEDILKTGVTVTLDKGPRRAGAIMAHELWHLIDIALSTEEGLPLKVVGNKVEYTSIIDGDYSWKTFKKGLVKKGTKTYNYYHNWSEILARYAEQYFAYKNSRSLFDSYLYRSWYWDEQEFLKLLPKFESFIKNRVGAKLLDEQNQFYHEVVRKINENIFNKVTLEFDENLNENEVKSKLDQIEQEYAWILQTVEGMKGDLKDEMEAYVQLSNLQSNYEMAKAKGEEYLEKIRITPEQQDTIDTMTTTVIPEPPQNPQTIRYGLPYFGGSNIENGIGKIMEGESGNEDFMKSYMSEQDRVNMNKKWGKKLLGYGKELRHTWNNLFTPAISRIYNRSPRIAGRLITMETQTEINIHRYRQRAKGFVETLGKLKGKEALEVKMALLDYGALASEQTEDTIEEYKNQEVAKLREVLKKNGFKDKDINDMFEVLNDIGRQYQDAGLSVTLTDLYFPRVVKDYEGLIDYMNRMSDDDIKVNKTSLLIKIRNIQSDPDMTAEEKESKIRNAISIEFKQPGTTSKHGKERKLGLLSDWGPGIYAYYENPIQSLDHYIVTMTNAIQRQLFLGGMKEDANITESDILNKNTAESVSTILGKLVEDGMVNEEDVNIIQEAILAVLNKKPSPKSITAMKDITYIATITNFLSAINQLDDLGMVILKDRSGLKHIAKTIFKRANIKYDDLGLEDSYEMFREEGMVTNWLFKKSFFNMFDRLGKTSFVNAAWESMMRQAKNEKTRKYLYTRLEAMYGKASADRMMEKIDSGNYNGEDGQVDIEILRDLLYQLGSTQPIYTSAMPVTYLNNPWARLCYALSSFTLKRIDWLTQGTKEVNKKHGPVAAGAWLMSVSSFLALFGAAIGDAGDLLKGDKEETFLWQFINKGIDEALKTGWSDAANSWLKIWDLSEYDLKLVKQQGIGGLLVSKITPFIFDLGKDVQQAITKHDANEITDLAKYVPIFGKLVYYWLWDDLESKTKTKKTTDSNGFTRREKDSFSKRDEDEFVRRDEKGFIRRN